ncbi:hypothetical protein V8C43DRAFT_274585 [Trichoderma afarasin]
MAKVKGYVHAMYVNPSRRPNLLYTVHQINIFICLSCGFRSPPIPAAPLSLSSFFFFVCVWGGYDGNGMAWMRWLAPSI